jgi:hypothetical protein
MALKVFPLSGSKAVNKKEVAERPVTCINLLLFTEEN